MKDQIVELYLDWVHNGRTVADVAAYNGISVYLASQLIQAGREIHKELSGWDRDIAEARHLRERKG